MTFVKFPTPIEKLVLLSLAIGASAHASLQVFPTRVELSDAKRVANISLRHLGAKASAYRVTAVFYRMKEDGSLELADNATAEEHSLTKFLRFSPRQATIPPNLEQVVRVMFSGGALEEGDYRAHLHFEPADEDDAPPVESKPGKISLNLRSRVAVSIPVIFRKGNPTYTVALSDLSLTNNDGKQGYLLTMTSTGKAFPYGDFEAFFTPKGSTKAEAVGTVKGVASYLPKRTVAYTLSSKISGPGTLRIEFHEPDTNGEGTKALATVETVVK